MILHSHKYLQHIWDNARRPSVSLSMVVSHNWGDMRTDTIHNTTVHHHLCTCDRIPCVHHLPVRLPVSHWVHLIPIMKEPSACTSTDGKNAISQMYLLYISSCFQRLVNLHNEGSSIFLQVPLPFLDPDKLNDMLWDRYHTG